MPIDPDLAALATAHGVDTWYEDYHRQRVDVDPDVVIAVLGLLDVDASTPKAVRAALAVAPAAPVHPEKPVGKPLSLPTPPATWGWMLQVYGLRSAGSWGVGDYADLATFARWAAASGAGSVLVNPMHAPMPVEPFPASPYGPSSRRFVNPLYLRVEDTDAYLAATDEMRVQIDALRPHGAHALIEYDETWRAKRAALEVLWPDQHRVPVEDPALRDFATYQAFAEVHGADWRTWPAELRRPDGPAVDKARFAVADRVAFHAWLQRLCQAQLRTARDAAAGMAVGIVHDLAVGVDPAGADGWMLQDVLAQGVRIGAPPDAFNQQGQDWGLAAWRPDRLAATNYGAYRELLRAVFGHAGGLRVDHVAGLWRLWWVPPGASADQGTYVRYDAQAMVGVLVEEARAAGAVVVGEDLGTVLPIVTEGLRDRDILGSSVLWFTRDDDGEFIPPARWPERALASVSTHDLPTALGFLTGEHVLARAEAGVLGRPVKEEWAGALADRQKLLELLDAEGLTTPESSDEDIVVALHELLARTPSRMVLASPYDVLEETRQPNLPGTVAQYPNWRIPLPTTLEQLMVDERVGRVIEILRSRSVAP